MRSIILGLAVAWGGTAAPFSLHAGDDADFGAVLERVREAVVVITSEDRRGEETSLGSGFLLHGQKLVATNYHVIGEGRRFRIQLPDRRYLTPKSIFAYDRKKDVALIQVLEEVGDGLKLGDADATRVGEPVAAVGHPLAMRLSVTRGVVAGVRELDDRPLLQLAMPIEVGNSGGPVVVESGRVVGMVVMKSAASMGFAVPVSEIQVLLEEPLEIPIDRWWTIGELRADRWATHMGGEWRQRAGKLIASGMGSGFGGRMLCLSTDKIEGDTFELEVDVRLDDESGAAGLVFHSDDGDRHYGFYPTSGALRLTRFDGPDVFTWKILETVGSEHYRLGEWNHVKVAVSGDRISCYCNGELVIEKRDDGLEPGAVGLVKFRQPRAEFRRFRVGASLPSREVSEERRQAVLRLADELPLKGEPGVEGIEQLSRDADAAWTVLRERAHELRRQASRLEQLATLAHARAVTTDLVEAMADRDTGTVDLLRGALLVARLDNRELDIDEYVGIVDSMAAELLQEFSSDMDDVARFRATAEYLFQELGFHGSRAEYFHRSNSYLNEVLEDREGLPIALSIVLIELAQRVGLKIDGLSIPNHFIVRFVPEKGEPILMDPFSRGRVISLEEASQLSRSDLTAAKLESASERGIIIRMLRNLFGVADREQDLYGMLRYVDAIVAVDPDSAYDRWIRAALRARTAQPRGAESDLLWLIEKAPSGVDLRQVRDLLERVRRH